VIFAESVKNPVADIDIGAEGLLQFRKAGLFFGVKGTGDLVDIIPDSPDLAEELAESFMVGGRAALGAWSWVTKGDCAHEGGDGEACLVGPVSNAGELVIGPSDEGLMGALPFITSAGHGSTRALSRLAAEEGADIFFERQAILGGPGREHGLLLVG
jgi:hypothetical protein